jgi:hypothetical protein
MIIKLQNIEDKFQLFHKLNAIEAKIKGVYLKENSYLNNYSP